MAKDATPIEGSPQRFLDMLGGLKNDERSLMFRVLARELDNHLYVRAQYGRTGQITEKDMELLFERFMLVPKTIRLSDFGGPDYYGKKNGNGQLTEPIPPLSPTS